MGSLNAQGVYVYDESDTEATASAMLNRQAAALAARLSKRQIGRSPYSAAGAGGTGGGFTWGALHSVVFPVAFPVGATPIITLAPVVGADHVQFAYPTVVSRTGFSYRIARLGATPPTDGFIHWTAEIG